MIIYYVTTGDSSIIYKGNVEQICEFLEGEFEKRFGFYPSFQSNTDDGYLEIYLHSDNNEALAEEEFEKLTYLGITESDSLSKIKRALNIVQIEQWEEEQIATCSVCSKSYHETFVNMNDYKEDVCSNCLPKYMVDAFKKDRITNVPAEPNFVGVCSFGGILDTPIFGTDLKELILSMRKMLDPIFDREKDDARIFKRYGSCSIEVYSFTEFSHLLFFDEIEVWKQTDEKVIRISRKELTDDMVVFYDPKDDM